MLSVSVDDRLGWPVEAGLSAAVRGRIWAPSDSVNAFFAILFQMIPKGRKSAIAEDFI